MHLQTVVVIAVPIHLQTAAVMVALMHLQTVVEMGVPIHLKTVAVGSEQRHEVADQSVQRAYLPGHHQQRRRVAQPTLAEHQTSRIS